MTRTKKRDPRLTKGLFHRGGVIYGKYKDASGGWKDVSLGLPVGSERDAAELLVEIKRQVAAGQVLGLDPRQGTPTFAGFFKWWIEQRKARKLRSWRNDESRIRNHVLPALGHLPLDEITPIQLEGVFLRMRDKDLAPKTVWNAYSAVRALYRDAMKKGFIRSSPCVLGKEELGAMVDKDPEWRGTAIYDRDEVRSLLFDPRVPADRRVFYAITFLAGRRLGETSGLRVRHVNLELGPLGSMVFAHSYAQGRTKTEQTVTMPVHPVLAMVLRWWLADGFREMFGRDPEPEDFVVPRPPRCRSKFGPCRDKNYVRKGLAADLKTLGLRHRRTHDVRRSFITQSQQDGANPQILMRLTHPSVKKATAFAGYTEYQWPDYCTEVAKLVVEVPQEAEAALATAVGSDDGDHDHDPTPGGARMPVLAPVPAPPAPRRRLRLAAPLAAPKEKPLEDPGVSQWRRRESNPGPHLEPT